MIALTCCSTISAIECINNVSRTNSFGINEIISAVCAVLTFIGIITSITISVINLIKQNRLSLLENRIKALQQLDDIVNELYMSNFTCKKYEKYIPLQIEVLFNKDVRELYENIVSVQKYCNELFNGRIISEKEGTWCEPRTNKFLTSDELMALMKKETDTIYNLYYEKKDTIYKEFIKL